MTLFYYIIKDFFKYVLGAVVLCTFLFVMFDFIHKTTKYFAVHKPKTEYIVQYYIYQLPSKIVEALPIASLLASVIAMVLMSRTNEITAMRAAGMGPLKIGTPIAVGGLILSATSIFLGEVVAPISATKMRYVKDVLIEGEPASEATEGVRWQRIGNKLYNFNGYDPNQGELKGVKIIETGLNFRPKQTIEASTARFETANNNWKLDDLRVLYFHPNGTLAYTERRDNQIVDLPFDPTKLQKERRKTNELGILELRERVVKGRQSGVDVSKENVDMHAKFAFHFAAFVVCLIGLKFGYRSERTVETAKGILLAVAIGVSYWFILNFGKALAMQGNLPPFIAAWMANIIIFGIGCFEIYRTRSAA